MELPFDNASSEKVEWGRSPAALFNRAMHVGDTVDYAAPRIEQLWRNSLIGGILGRDLSGRKTEYGEVFSDPNINWKGRAAYVGGRVVNDLLGDGSRVPYWFLNHPLAATGALAQSAAVAAGLAPDYGAIKAELTAQGKPHSRAAADALHAKRMGFAHGAGTEGIPSGLGRGLIPFLAATSLVQASGNHDLLNILQGGRRAGYEAILPSESDPRQTSFVPGEMALRYVIGRTGRLLPWEEFTQERPEVSPEDYGRAKAHQFDRGLLNLGLIKATSRNIEGEPEATAMGFRVPFSAAAAAGGAMIGGIAGSNQLEGAIEQALAGRRKAELRKGMLSTPAGRKMLGAIVGAGLGALSGKAGGQAVNDLVIQPVLHPDLVEAERNWLAEREARTLLAQQVQAQQL